MMDFVGDEFDGVISGVSSFGFWVETVEQKCEGLVSVRDLSEYDDFRLDEADYALVGLKSGRKFRMGDLIRVKLVSANQSRRQLDFEWVPGSGKKDDSGKKHEPEKKKQLIGKREDKRSKKESHKKKKK